ncbi:MAG: ABC transporter permease [Gemmatimonadaceae bacterium]
MRSIVRGLLRVPGLTALAIACIAIGIAAVTTMSTVVDVLLFRAPPHVHDAEQIRRLKVHLIFPGGSEQQQLTDYGSSLTDYLALGKGLRDAAELAAYTTAGLSLDRGATAEPVTAGFAGASFFHLLDVRPALGHWYPGSRADGSTDPAHVVLSYAIWQRRFGASRAVIGRTIRVGHGTYQIVAVAPPGFRGVDLSRVDLWLPLGAARQEIFDDDSRSFYGAERFQILARFRTGVPDNRARSEASAILQDSYVDRFGAAFGGIVVVSPVSIIPAHAGAWSSEAILASWLSAMAGVVLLIACGNVGGLLLVRATERRRAMAIRLALGARRVDVALLLGSEGLAVAAAGGLAGIVLASWATPVLQRLLMPGAAITPLTSDWKILVATAVLIVAVGVGCSVLPAMRSMRWDYRGLLGGTSSHRGPRITKQRHTLLGGQVALATTLTAAAVLFLTSWWHLKSTDLGVSSEQVLVVRANLPDNGYTDEQTARIYESLLARLRSLPDVRAGSAALNAPFVSRTQWPGVTVPGGSSNATSHELFDINAVGRDFFASTGTSLLQGHDFAGSENAGTERVVIINARMKRRYWPDADPIGQCIAISEPGPARPVATSWERQCVRIIGVAQDTRTAGPREQAPMQLYVPLGQWPAIPQTLILHTRSSASLATPTVRHAIREVDGSLPYVDVRSVAELIAPVERPWLLAASLFSLLCAVALALAAAGIYASFSYAVFIRSHELGIRLALGSSREAVILLITRSAAETAALGILAGLLGAFIVGHVMMRLLIDTSPTSPLVLASTATTVFVVALLAVLAPAYRAATLDPVAVMRAEVA